MSTQCWQPAFERCLRDRRSVLEIVRSWWHPAFSQPTYTGRRRHKPEGWSVVALAGYTGEIPNDFLSPASTITVRQSNPCIFLNLKGYRGFESLSLRQFRSFVVNNFNNLQRLVAPPCNAPKPAMWGNAIDAFVSKALRSVVRLNLGLLREAAGRRWLDTVHRDQSASQLFSSERFAQPLGRPARPPHSFRLEPGPGPDGCA